MPAGICLINKDKHHNKFQDNHSIVQPGMKLENIADPDQTAQQEQPGPSDDIKYLLGSSIII